MNVWAPQKIAVISLWAENVPEAVHFYRDILGLQPLSHHSGGRPHFKIGGIYLVIHPGSPRPASQEHFPALAFAVEDLDRAVEHLQAHQIVLPWGVEEDSQSRWVKLHDPAGNLIELVQFERDA
jgi:catechol 2,3-dioxygenase-like lactoylglutathione lyase family enzyme